MSFLKHKNYFFIIIALFFYFLPNNVKAFIPPDTLIQGISAGFSAISAAAAFLISGIVIVFGAISLILRKHRKLFFILLIENIVLITICAGIFYSEYYKPLSVKFNNLAMLKLSKNQNSESIQKDNKGASPAEAKNENNESNNGPKNKFKKNPQVDQALINKHGILANSLGLLNRNFYFIDVREIEEFERKHIENARHLRAMDVSIDSIKSTFNLSESEFKNSLFILYCHDGMRSSATAERIDLPNVKFLVNPYNSVWIDETEKNNSEIKWIEKEIDKNMPFPDEKYNDFLNFYVTADEIKKIIEKDNYIIFDGTVLGTGISLKKFIIPYMTTKKYNEKIKELLNNKEQEIIILAQDKSEYFFAKILFQRLEKKYGFNFKKFHISFKENLEKAQNL